MQGGGVQCEVPSPGRGEVQRLQRELQTSRAEVQTMWEELQTSREEVQLLQGHLGAACRRASWLEQQLALRDEQARYRRDAG